MEVHLSKNFDAAVARSTFASQNVKNMRGSGPLFDVQLSKNCGRWHVQDLHAAVAGSTFTTQYVQNTPCWRHFYEKR